MLIRIIEVIILILLGVISDIQTYKIRNKIVYPFMLIGIITNVYFNKYDGLVFSLMGMILPAMVLFILFALRMLGAGDIKLLCAIGSIMGARFILNAMAYAFICGGIMALLILLVNRNCKNRMIYFCNYIKLSFLTLSLRPYIDFEDENKGVKFHFSYAIACGTLIAGLLSVLGSKLIYCC